MINATPLKELIAKFDSDEEDNEKENQISDRPMIGLGSRQGRNPTRRPLSYQQPLTPVSNKKSEKIDFELKLKQSDGVFSSSDSLDTDEILSGVNEFNSPRKIPMENAPFSIKSRKPPQRRGQVQQSPAPPNTVSITRRNIPARQRNSPNKSAYHGRPSRSQTPPISKMEPIQMKENDIQGGSVKLTAVQNPLSPERRTRSYDSNLDQLDSVEPLTPTKKRAGIFGSFEKGLDQVRLLLTPKKDRQKAQGILTVQYV